VVPITINGRLKNKGNIKSKLKKPFLRGGFFISNAIGLSFLNRLILFFMSIFSSNGSGGLLNGINLFAVTAIDNNMITDDM
jgi:hypothetical protein